MNNVGTAEVYECVKCESYSNLRHVVSFSYPRNTGNGTDESSCDRLTSCREGRTDIVSWKGKIRIRDTVMLQYFYFCKVCECLSITISTHIDLWEWLLVGVVITNECTTDDKPEKAVPTST